MNKHTDSPYRSILKTISWRFTATITTFIGCLFLTKNLNIAITLGIFEFVSKFFIYYIHERLWNKINWGKK